MGSEVGSTLVFADREQRGSVLVLRGLIGHVARREFPNSTADRLVTEIEMGRYLAESFGTFPHLRTVMNGRDEQMQIDFQSGACDAGEVFIKAAAERDVGLGRLATTHC